MSSKYDRKDALYRKAKDEGYRSRAAYKLIEIDDRHKILRAGASVLDLGAWPGGWLQVASNRVGVNGVVVGVDLVKIEDLSSSVVRLIQGDASSPEVLAEAREFSPGEFDVVLSDMSPKFSGIKEADRARAIGVAELALFVSEQMLRMGGCLVVKVFKSEESAKFYNQLRRSFDKVSRSELDATRKTSNEFYLIAQGFKKEIK